MEHIKNYNYRQEIADSPLRILCQQTRQVIAMSLDSRKLLLTKTRLHRDWRGLAEKAELDLSVIRSSKISFTEHCFNLWIQKGALVRDLLEALESIDRFDVIDDTLQIIYNDYDNAMSKDVLRLKPVPPSLDEIQSSITQFDANVLTTDDQRNLSEGGTLEYYDALVLFADEDLDFVEEMVQKLEGEYNLKLCLKDRNLVGGLAFELSAVMRLIEERCARVIVVLSPAFLKSKANKFFTQFAYALGVDRQRRIVIPCMYEPCEKPPEISFCHSLDYYRTNGYWDYWKKLADSLTHRPLDHGFRNPPTLQKPIIQEISHSSSLTIPSPALTISFPDLPSPPTDIENSSSISIFNRLRKKDVRSPRQISEVSNISPTHLSDVADDTYSFSSFRSDCTSPTVSTAPLLPIQSEHKDQRVWSMFKKLVRPNKNRKKKPISA